MLNLHKIKIHFCTRQHHQSNGIVEKFYSTLIEHLRILQQTHPEDKESIIEYAIIGYKNSIHSSTSFSPMELTFGHTSTRDPDDIFTPRTFFNDYVQNHKNKLNKVYAVVKQKLIQNKEKIVEKKNVQGDKNSNFKIGQVVYKKNPKCRTKKTNKFLGPYKIIKVLTRNRVEISNNKSKKNETVHINEIRKPFKNVTDASPSDSEQNSDSE